MLRCIRRTSAAARLLRSWVRIPPGAWIFVCCECCVLSGRGLCDELITRPEESYWLWCVVVCDLETSRMRRPWPALGRSTTAKKKCYTVCALRRSRNRGHVVLTQGCTDSENKTPTRFFYRVQPHITFNTQKHTYQHTTANFNDVIKYEECWTNCNERKMKGKDTWPT